MKHKILILYAIVFLMTGCQPGRRPDPPVTLAVQAVVPTPIILIITQPPRATATFTPTPRPAFDISQYQGRWQLELTYHVYGYPVFSDIRYNGGIDLNVSDKGEVSGSGVIYAVLRQPPCNAVVKDAVGLDVAITGKLTARLGLVVGNLNISPGNANARETFVLACAEESRSREVTMPLLWPALTITNQLNPQLTFAPNTVITSLRSLTGPSGGRLYGTLASEIRLNR